MIKQEAIVCLKEILSYCQNDGPQTYLLMRVQDSGRESYSIHLKSAKLCKQQFNHILEKNNLLIKEENGEMIFQKKTANLLNERSLETESIFKSGNSSHV